MNRMLQLTGMIQPASRLGGALLGLSPKSGVGTDGIARRLDDQGIATTQPISGSHTGKEAVLFSVTAKIGAIDLEKREVTLKGPRGNCLTARARDVNNLQRLRLGDTIGVTNAEALAVSLEKTATKAAKD